MKKIITFFNVFLLVFISMGNLVYADISEEQSKLIDSGILYYDIEGGEVCSPTNTTSISNAKVYILGDSITVRSEGAITDAFAKTNHQITKINADVGRAISKDTIGNDLSGIEAVKQDADIIKNSDVIVVALGTNSGGENVANEINNLVREIKSINGNINILWVNTFFTTDISTKNQINQAISDQSNLLQYSVLDLSIYEIPLVDGIHPTVEGSVFFAEKITENIGTVEGDGNISPTQTTGLPETLDPRWIPVWVNAAKEYGTDPAYLGAIFTSEHSGNFSSYDGDSDGRWARPNGTFVADDTEAAAGPFQFLGSSWDDIVGRMGESWPRSDRDDPVKSSRAAAKYLSMIGGVPGLEAGSFDQPQGFKPNRSEVPYTVASLAARYNQGLVWHDGRPVAGGNNVEWYVNNAAEKYELLRGKLDGSTLGSTDCPSGTLSAGANGWDLPGEGPNPMIYYSQLREGNDSAVSGYFGNEPYGFDSISKCGCGPTSFAMIVSTLTGIEVTPTEMAAWASENGFQQDTCGSYWWWEDNPEITADKWGVRARQINIGAAEEELRRGNLIIVSVGPGSVFLSPGGNGHLLVMRAVTDEGKYLFADPSDSQDKRSSYPILTELGSSRTPVDASTVTNGLKAMWVVEVL